MRKLLLLTLLLSFNTQAYDIGGMYAQLLSCDWTRHGYTYGYMGTYRGTDGGIYKIFFGDNYCQY